MVLIKIDVEGHEPAALAGAERTILKNRPVILFEQKASGISNGRGDVIDQIAKWNYEFYTTERNYNLGKSVIGRATSLLLRFLFGEVITFRKTERFERRFYDMVVAVPKG